MGTCAHDKSTPAIQWLGFSFSCLATRFDLLFAPRSLGQRSQYLPELVFSQTRLPNDKLQEPTGQIFAMDWDRRRRPSVGVRQKEVAPRLMVRNKAGALQRPDDLPRGE